MRIISLAIILFFNLKFFTQIDSKTTSLYSNTGLYNQSKKKAHLAPRISLTKKKDVSLISLLAYGYYYFPDSIWRAFKNNYSLNVNLQMSNYVHYETDINRLIVINSNIRSMPLIPSSFNNGFNEIGGFKNSNCDGNGAIQMIKSVLVMYNNTVTFSTSHGTSNHIGDNAILSTSSQNENGRFGEVQECFLSSFLIPSVIDDNDLSKLNLDGGKLLFYYDLLYFNDLSINT